MTRRRPRLLSPDAIAALEQLEAHYVETGRPWVEADEVPAASRIELEVARLVEYDPITVASALPLRPAWTAPRRTRPTRARLRITDRGRRRLEAIRAGRRRKMRVR